MAGYWTGLTDCRSGCPGGDFRILRVARMASGAVLWFGDFMSAVPLRNNKVAASAVRTVTVLGATGSIGDRRWIC